MQIHNDPLAQALKKSEMMEMERAMFLRDTSMHLFASLITAYYAGLQPGARPEVPMIRNLAHRAKQTARFLLEAYGMDKVEFDKEGKMK